MKLVTENLSKDFGGVTALRNINFEIETGDSQAIIGPNGAGKTTFFNILTGVITPTSGQITLGNEDITGEPPHRIAKRGLVKSFQQTNIFNDETVFENIRIAAQVSTTTFNMYSNTSSLSSVNQLAERIIDRINIGAETDEIVNNLPYGDKRKIEIGIALATQPDILLLDEPTAGMSQDGIEEIIGLLENIVADPELTVVLTEHDIDLILDLVETIIVFNKGEILSEGTPEGIVKDEEVQRVYLGS